MPFHSVIRTPHRLIQLQRPSEAGQATVEYVGLAVAVAVLLMAAGSGLGDHGGKLGSALAKRLTQAITMVQGS
jgi:hypothetical protein